MLQYHQIKTLLSPNPLGLCKILAIAGFLLNQDHAHAQSFPEKAGTEELDPLAAMEVVHVNLKPPFFAVNRGRNHGLKIGDLICAITAYDDYEDGAKPSNKQKDSQQCGPVVTLKPGYAGVGMTEEQARHVKIEHAAIRYHSPPPAKAPVQLLVGFHFAERAPFSYQLVKFNLNSFINESDPVWLQEVERANGYAAPFLSIATLKTQLWPFGGLRLVLSPVSWSVDSVDTDYSITDPDLHTKTTVKNSGINLDTLMTFEWNPLLPFISMGPIWGIQWGRYQMDQQVNLIDDKTGDQRRFVSHSAKWLSASLVLGWFGRINWNSWLLEGSWSGTLPVWMSQTNESPRVDLPVGLPASGSDSEGYRRLVDLKKGKFGQNITVSVGYEI